MKKIMTVMSLLFIASCANNSKQSRPTDSELRHILDAMEVTSCTILEHPFKINSTGDFSACSYNNHDNDEETRDCMSELGWKYTSNLQACDVKSPINEYEDIEFCLSKSKIGKLISHKLINECLDTKPTRNI